MDQIDRLSGIAPGSELFEIRRERPDFVDGTELCRRTVLAPVHGFALGHGLRAALAARMSRFIGRADLAKSYDEMLSAAGSTPLLLEIAAAGDVAADDDAFLKAIIRHADLVTKTPRNNTKADIEALETAGLSSPQIIALSELIAFVNFEARVIAGLEILGEVA
jgi:uncharacterized protein YciW